HEAHLRAQLHLLFAQEGNLADQLIAHRDDSLGGNGTVLRAAEAQHVDMCRKVCELAAEMRGSVSEPRPVQVQVQPFSPAELAQSAQLIERVAGSDLGHLSNLDNLGLRTVFVTSITQPGTDQLRGELAVDRRDGHDFVPEIALRGTALIDIEM